MKQFLYTMFLCVFVSMTASAQIVISEIMYNPPEGGNDSLEFIELYNSTTAAIELTGYKVSGAVDRSLEGITIEAEDFIILTINKGKFLEILGLESYEWDSPTALNNTGESIILNGPNGIVDSVAYADGDLWSTVPDGNGPSLELCSLDEDNNVPSNWGASEYSTGIIVNGKELKCTPGKPNSISCADPTVVTSIDDDVSGNPDTELTINVIGNDQIPTAPVSVTIFDLPANGTATVNADFSVTYLPNAGYCGTDAFTYIACNTVSCDTAKVNVDIMCPIVYPTYSIATVTGTNADGVADSLDVDCILGGVVYGVNLNTAGLAFTIIDAAGDGIAVYSMNNAFGYTVQEGDEVSISGKIGQFNGLTQLYATNVIGGSSGNALVSPTVVTTLDESTESDLVKFVGLNLVDPQQWNPGGSGFNVDAIDANGNTVTIRIDADTDNFNAAASPGQNKFDVIGIGGQFDNSSPFTGGYQLLPRYQADFDITVSTTQLNAANIEMYPNPVSDLLTIKANSNISNISISNAMGQVISTVRPAQHSYNVNMANWTSGIYQVQITTIEGIVTKRVVKM